MPTMRDGAGEGDLVFEPGLLLVVGLDGEMSSTDLSGGGRLIQAGLAVCTDRGVDVFSELIRWPALDWSQDAARVHGIQRAQLADARHADEVDDAAYHWLVARGASCTRQAVSVGFNVSSFDHPFFHHALPRTMGLISHRAIDLNSLCFTLDGAPGPSGTPMTWMEWKERAKLSGAAALAALGFLGQEHDAGYDAALAITTWGFLKDEMRSPSLRGVS